MQRAQLQNLSHTVAAQALALANWTATAAAQATQLGRQGDQIADLLALVHDLSASSTTAPASFAAPISTGLESTVPCGAFADADCGSVPVATTTAGGADATRLTTIPVLGAARPINDDALVLAGSTVGAAVVVAAFTVGVAVWCVKRNKRGGKHVVHAIAHRPHGSAIGAKAVHIAVVNGDDYDRDASSDSGHNNAGGTAAVALTARLRKRLQAQPQAWTSLRTMVRLVRELSSFDDRLLDETQHATRTEAIDTLQKASAEYRVLLDAAVATQDFDKAKFYQTRIAHLTIAHAPVLRDASPYECVADGLLLRRDRFDGDSEAFLGRGASSAVSRGLLVEVVGSYETRTAVAVKEVPKTGFANGQKAVRELAIVTQKLGTHRNVVGIHAVKPTGSTFYIVMELCLFSLDEQPDTFRHLLHAPDSPEAALVLNALVQDLLRGAAFLHSKHVFHCDLKPANVLVALDRGGKKRCDFKPKYFRQAQLKLADFGVSRVVKPSKSHGGGGTDSATTTTATVSLAGLQQAQGVAGTKAYMCPTLLKILRDVKAGKMEREPEIAMELLARNDAFGCGCVVAFLCSDGKHPFQHAVFKSVPDNILANRRVKLHKLGMKDARHIELVDKLTSKHLADCWTVAETLHRSSVFEAASHGADAAEVLLDIIQLRQKPAGSCRDQLLAEPLTSRWPLLKDMVEQIDAMLEALRRNELPVELDDDSCVSGACGALEVLFIFYWSRGSCL